MAIAGTPDSADRRLWAGKLALGDHAAVWHRAAIWSHRIGASDAVDVVEFTVPRSASTTREGLVTTDRSPSFLEAKALRLFRQHGLPEPRVELKWGDHGQFRLDFIWLDCGLVEVDGWDCHASHRARQYDLRRRNQIVLGNLRPLVYTYGDIVRRGTTVIKEIRAAVAAVA